MANGIIVLATPAPLSHRTSEENLGLGYLAAVLRKYGYNTVIVDGWLSGMSYEEIASSILNYTNIIWVGFSCYRSNMEQTMKSSKMIKAANKSIPIVVGGYGPTFDSEAFLKSGADIVVRGEAENIVTKLTEHFISGFPPLRDIEGISFFDGHSIVNNKLPQKIPNLDSLPFPARDTMNIALKQRTPVHILSARGCMANCIFCSIASFWHLSDGPQWRQRSIKNFVDELELLSKQGVRHFKVVDDSMLEPPRDLEWCHELACEIMARGLSVRLRGSVRADRVNEDIVRELSMAGFFSFSCGIENFSNSALRRMNKTATLEQNLTALDAFKKYKIYVQAGHILFDYGTTLDELWENLKYMQNYMWIISKGVFTEMYAADSTPYTRLLQKKGLLMHDERGLGNNKYLVQDQGARNVYDSLKEWHKHHMRVYDKAIDPLTSPKALESDELALVHRVYMKLHRKDIEVFKTLLEMADANEKRDDMLTFVENEIKQSEEWYIDIDTAVNHLYEQFGLTYNAIENPFIY